jgi:hypothetical protein
MNRKVITPVSSYSRTKAIIRVSKSSEIYSKVSNIGSGNNSSRISFGIIGI